MDKFEEVFNTENLRIPENLWELGFESVTEVENNMLLSIPIEEEIKVTVFALHPLKAPGPDGFLGVFFRHYSETIRYQVVGLIQESFRSGNISRGTNNSFIVLIPKVQNATEFNHFRPISLCNFTYKIISKIITKRLKTFLPRLISQTRELLLQGDGLLIIQFWPRSLCTK